MKPDTNGGASKASNRRTFLRTVAAAGSAAVLAAPHIRNAEAARSHVWKVQSTWDAGTTGYRLFEEWAKSFQEKSDGELEMRPFPAKAVAADNNALFDAVRHRRAAGHESLHAVLVGQNSRLRVPVVLPGGSRSGVAVGHHVLRPRPAGDNARDLPEVRLVLRRPDPARCQHHPLQAAGGRPGTVCRA